MNSKTLLEAIRGRLVGNLFLTVLNMSLTASYVIVFVIIIRLLIKKIPKIYSYVLWFAVLFRLTCPLSFESIFSFIPENVNIPQDIAYSPKPEINSGIAAIDSAVTMYYHRPLIRLQVLTLCKYGLQ